MDELSKGQLRIAGASGLLLFPILPPLLKWLPGSPVAFLTQVVGHKGADGRACWFVLVVIIIETFAPSASRRVNGSFPARPFAHIVDAAVLLSLQPAVVVEVLVLFVHFLKR